MFSHIWSAKKSYYSSNSWQSKINGLSPIIWREHCVECAMPDCYSSCLLYERRDDGRCRRFTHGFQRVNFEEGGHFGARMVFKRWAKLEAVFPNKISVISPAKIPA